MQHPTLSKSLIALIGLTAKNQRLFIADRLKANQFDLTFAQWVIIARLFREDGQSQNDLAYITERDKASLTRLINTLEKKNLVARIPSKEDKRANRIFLTKHGRTIFQKTMVIVNETFDIMQEGIKEKDQELVVNVLQKIQNNINNSPK